MSGESSTVDYPAVFGQEAWDDMLTDCTDQASWMGASDVKEIALLVGDALGSLLAAGALHIEYRQGCDCLPEQRLVSRWRTT